uniref:Uncharacterized protein n=2 Tax=Meloidogyne TaxID=189290 RepID=A0A914L4P6_MELIC
MPSYSRRSESRDRDRHRSSRKRSRSRDESSDRKRKRSEKRRDKKREKNRSKSSTPNERIYAPANVACELDGGNINMAQLDKKTVDWLHEKINDQGELVHVGGVLEKQKCSKAIKVVSSRLGDIEEIIRERVSAAKIDMEQRLRLQIESELKEEMEAIQRRENESKERCLNMERALIEKIKQLDESEKQLSDERLQMLESKRLFEEKRIELDREKELLKKNEQQSILNKGGSQRAPIRMRLGSGR